MVVDADPSSQETNRGIVSDITNSSFSEKGASMILSLSMTAVEFGC